MSVAFIVVQQSVFVSESEFYLAERASSVVELVKVESVEFGILVLLNNFVEGLSSFVDWSAFRHFIDFIINSSLLKI